MSRYRYHQKTRPTSSTIAQNLGEGHEMEFGLPKLSTCVLGDQVDPLKNIALPPNETSAQNLLDAHDIAAAPSPCGIRTVLNLDQVEPLKVKTKLSLSDAAQKLAAGHVMLSRKVGPPARGWGGDQVFPLNITTSACCRPPATAQNVAVGQETAAPNMPSFTGPDQRDPLKVLTRPPHVPLVAAQKVADGHDTERIVLEPSLAPADQVDPL